VQILANMFRSSTRLLASTTLALGLAALGPALAHAGEARPLGMRDLGTSSTLGVAMEGGVSSSEIFDSSSSAFMGALHVDGELAITEHAKIFASFPLVMMSAEDSAQSVTGHGNVTVGAQVQGGNKDLHGAVGLSASGYGDRDAAGFVLYDYDMSAYGTPGKVIAGFAAARLGQPDGYYQFEVDYQRYRQDASNHGGGDSESGFEVGTVRVGGGVRAGAGTMVVGELGVRSVLESSGTLYLGELGVRGRLGDDSSATWAAKVTFQHGEILTAGGIGFELRADLPGLAQ
jgi:hypothetical protein